MLKTSWYRFVAASGLYSFGCTDAPGENGCTYSEVPNQTGNVTEIACFCQGDKCNGNIVLQSASSMAMSKAIKKNGVVRTVAGSGTGISVFIAMMSVISNVWN